MYDYMIVFLHYSIHVAYYYNCQGAADKLCIYQCLICSTSLEIHLQKMCLPTGCTFVYFSCCCFVFFIISFAFLQHSLPECL